METFMLIALVPVIWAILARLVFKASFTWLETGAQIVAVCVITGIVTAAGMYGQTADFEVWNGQVTDKKREHGSYVESYSCNCRSVSSGSGKNKTTSTVCDTCYRDHYTVEWYLKSTIGNIRIDYLDRTSRSVYSTKDPKAYTAAFKGEACSRTKGYTNYIKAVPESLFNEVDLKLNEQFAAMIPAYPTVHSIYKVNRVIPVGVNVPGIAKMNKLLSDELRTIGAKKQANIIVVFANTADQSYRYALERAWLGGKKNDVIVILGTPEYPAVAWVDTITLGENSGNEMMTVQMRDQLMALPAADDHELTVGTIAGVVTQYFDRKAMADYEYLEDEITPPTWVIVTALVLAVLVSIGLTWYFHNNDPFGNSRSFSRRYRTGHRFKFRK